MPFRPTPPFVAEAESIEAVRQAAKQIKELRLESYALQSREIEKFGRNADNVQRLGTAGFSLAPQRWTDFVNSEDGRLSVGGSPLATKVAWYRFFSTFPTVIGPIVDRMGIRHRDRNPIVSVFHEWLAPGDPYPARWLEKLAGRYAVYRPHFLDPSKIIVMELRCGVENDWSRFEINLSYPRPGKTDPIGETIEGFIIPYEQCALFQGKIKDADTPFIFILSNFIRNVEGRSFEHAEGAVLVGASGTLPSAYPMMIWRAQDPVKCRVAERAQLQGELTNWDEIDRVLRRGMVTWR